MSAKLAEADQMTIEEFLGFTDSRPDGEKWELIEGKACMSPSPTDWHQIICGNVLHALLSFKQSQHSSWLPMIGIGTKVPISPNSLPQPDVFVKEGAVTGSHVTDDALIVFEVALYVQHQIRLGVASTGLWEHPELSALCDRLRHDRRDHAL